MKKFLRILLSLFSACFGMLLHAQEPGTVVGIYILEKGSIVAEEKMDSYQVSVKLMHKVTMDHKTGLFQSFCWNPYNDQHYVITIKHGSKKMQIEFYVGNPEDFSQESSSLFWNASFRFDVEFIPGFYRIGKFKKTTGKEWLKLEPTSNDWNFWICSTCND